MSLNLVLLGVLAAFVTLHVALRALSALFSLPQQARRWRLQQRERALLVALLDALSHLMAGRFIRARKSAELALTHESHLVHGGDSLPYGGRLRVVSHLLAAQSAHALQDKDGRAAHFGQALAHTERRDALEAREGVQLRGAQWALDDRDAAAALRWLEDLPQGASRRTVAMRLRLKAARLSGQTGLALDTARLLRKHRAFSDAVGQSIVRGLILEQFQGSRDSAQLQKVWDALDARERADADLALAAAVRQLALGGSADQARHWLLPVWEQMEQAAAAGAGKADLTPAQQVRLVAVLEQSFVADLPGAGGAPDAAWLTRIETAQLGRPGAPLLQYLAGMACMRLKLWGKAQQLLRQCAPQLRDAALTQRAWLALATLAEQRDDAAGAKAAYQNAIKAAAG
jgi:HemY protein